MGGELVIGSMEASEVLKPSQSYTARMVEAINGMLLDMYPAVAGKDYEYRRRC